MVIQKGMTEADNSDPEKTGKIKWSFLNTQNTERRPEHL